MHKRNVERVTRQLQYMALMNGSFSEGAVTAERQAVRGRDKYGLPRYRVRYFLNGNLTSRENAAKFLHA